MSININNINRTDNKESNVSKTNKAKVEKTVKKVNKALDYNVAGPTPSPEEKRKRIEAQLVEDLEALIERRRTVTGDVAQQMIELGSDLDGSDFTKLIRNQEKGKLAQRVIDSHNKGTPLIDALEVVLDCLKGDILRGVGCEATSSSMMENACREQRAKVWRDFIGEFEPVVEIYTWTDNVTGKEGK